MLRVHTLLALVVLEGLEGHEGGTAGQDLVAEGALVLHAAIIVVDLLVVLLVVVCDASARVCRPR